MENQKDIFSTKAILHAMEYDALDAAGKNAVDACFEAVMDHKVKQPEKVKQPVEPAKEIKHDLQVAAEMVRTEIVDPLEHLNAALSAVSTDMLKVTEEDDKRIGEWFCWNFIRMIEYSINNVLDEAASIAHEIGKIKVVRK